MAKYDIKNKNELLRKIKEILIPVHGSVSITLIAMCFIDNRFFQRLSELKQLGLCYIIFPGAVHTRFEHSIGTYYLADRILQRIKSTTDPRKIIEWLSKIPELQSNYQEDKYNVIGLDDWTIELIKIASLCHDIGHGPYSHIFDDVFIKNSEYKNHPMATHESRSCALVKKIVEDSEILSKYMTDNDIRFIQSLIDPSYNIQDNVNRSGFVYQIVSNNLNGLDVDKYDYICRDTLHTSIKNGFDHTRLIDAVLVIDNTIVFPEQSEYDIYNMYLTRHSLHRKIYGHKGVVSAQYIITEIMSIVDKVINIASSITNIDRFVKMTDQYIVQYMEFILEMKDNVVNPFNDIMIDRDYEKLKELKWRLETHNLYPHIGTIITKEPFDMGNTFNDDDHMIFRCKVGFVSGDKPNPLDSIYVYKTKDIFINEFNVKARKINKNEISYIIPNIYQEFVTMVFSRDNDHENITKDKEKFKTIQI